MREKILLNILIPCAILSHVIGTSFEENEQISNIIVRKKRLINYSTHEIEEVAIEKVPYIVNILENGVSFCGGSILALNIIITAAHCIVDNHAKYTVLSGSPLRDRGLHHNVIMRLVYPNYNPPALSDGLALLKIWPPIRHPNSKIDLYSGSLPRNAQGTFSGWGCIHASGNITVFPLMLQSITVHIISRKKCKSDYPDYSQMTNKDICTLDANKQKGSCYGDSGGPLVVNGHLLGVLTWSRGIPNPEYPDVFLNLAVPVYKNWIDSMMRQHGI